MNSLRDTTVRSSGEILRRLLFVVYLAGAFGGGLLLLAGAARHRADFAIGGVVALVVSGILQLLQRRWRAAGLIQEIAGKPICGECEPDGDE